LKYGIGLNAGCVFADIWDLGLFSTCPECLEQQISRINAMNLNQEIVFGEKCSCETKFN